ncbi:MAG: hypothetical protein WCI48_09355 [Bacteroidota bacterium]|jgi:hypothetical protein
MYITNLSHFLDKQGNIVKEMHQESREMAGFLALIVDAATKEIEPQAMATIIRCHNKKCAGTIEIVVGSEKDEIMWMCTHCDDAGKISGWQKTRWDNRI